MAKTSEITHFDQNRILSLILAPAYRLMLKIQIATHYMRVLIHLYVLVYTSNRLGVNNWSYCYA